jgi:drug/metabolite transporter (DMT)-like permease
MLSACLFFSVFDALTKVLSNTFSLGELGVARFGFGLLVTFPILIRQNLRPNRRDFFFLILRGLLGIGVFFAIIKAFRVSSFSVTMVLFYTSPIWALLMGIYFLKERLFWRTSGAITISIVGIVILTGGWRGNIEMGHLYGLLAGVMVGGNSVVTRHLRFRHDSTTIYAFQCLVGTLFSIPLIVRDIHLPSFDEGILLLIAVTFGLLSQITMNYGYKFVRAAEGATLMMAEAVFAALVGIIIFREPFNLQFLFGALMIISSGVYIGLFSNRRLAGYLDRNNQG